MNSQFWRGKRVLITGHTGFKGSWLSLWLQSLGAEVTGYALNPPTNPSLFDVARVGEAMTTIIADIRDLPALKRAMQAGQPQIIFHMAAQPLVRYSYQNPVETYSTNVMGTLHLLESARITRSVKSVVVVTSDKCYGNREWTWGYRENEPMGGHDPYSSSKACTEIVTSAYRSSFLQEQGISVATARAGNVIGGGDWAADRLVPDIFRAFESNQPVVVRNPHATRPWQHVLEPLSGYLLLAERLYNQGEPFAEGWNFGPQDEDTKEVLWIVQHMVKSWGHGASWQQDSSIHVHEANYLKLDISKAKARLEWRPRWALQTALAACVDWHLQNEAGADMNLFTVSQINQFTLDGIRK